MGFWDAHLTNLEALGITFSPLYEKVLEGGGQVLHLRHLLSPDSTPEYEVECYDQHNEPVWVIEKLTTFAPRQPAIMDGKVFLAADMMTEEHGDEWRAYPSCLGHLEDCDRYCQGGPMCECQRSEYLGFYRFWDCYPLLDEGLYEDLASACAARIDASLYNEIMDVSMFEWHDGDASMDIRDLWLYHNEPERLDLEDATRIEDWLDETRADPDRVAALLAAYEAVVESEFLPPPWHSFTRDGHWEGKHFEMPAMEAFLQGKPLALEVWRTMLAAREQALRQIQSVMPSNDRRLFNYQERLDL